MIRKQHRVLKERKRPKVAFFELTSCEGCQLQIINRESGLLKFLNTIEIVNFREAVSGSSSSYEIAFIEGSVNNEEQVRKVREIRSRAEIVVALGSCACFGGINTLADESQEGIQSRPVDDYIKVDEQIYGCPVKKQEIETILSQLIAGHDIVQNAHPVCYECKMNNNLCLMESGEPCLGSVTRAGCDAWCTGSGVGCWGCRGPAVNATPGRVEQLKKRKGIEFSLLAERMNCFGGFSEFSKQIM